MKELYIEDKRVIIGDEELYIPFRYQIIDLNSPEIINMPVSKTIDLPRNAQNDEIFGFVGDISRINTNFDDYKQGVDFNQIKKSRYKLYSNGLIVNSGLVLVQNVTETTYSIILINSLIDKLEKLGVTEDQGDGIICTLQKMKLYDTNDNLINFKSNPFEIANLSYNTSYGIIPTFNIDEDPKSKTNIYCYSEAVSDFAKNTLPEDCSQMQIKTYKDWETNYAISFKILFNSLNKNDFGFGTDWLQIDEGITYILNEESKFVLDENSNNLITEDSIQATIDGTDVASIINDLYLYCKYPKKTTNYIKQSSIKGYENSVTPPQNEPNIYYPLLRDSKYELFNINNTKSDWVSGKYTYSTRMKFKFKPMMNYADIQNCVYYLEQDGIKFYLDGGVLKDKNGNLVETGTELGQFMLSTNFSMKPSVLGTLADEKYSNMIISKIPLIWGTTIYVEDYISDKDYVVVCDFNLPISVDLPFDSYQNTSEYYLSINTQNRNTTALNFWEQKEIFAIGCSIMNTIDGPIPTCVNPFYIKINDTTCEIKSEETYSGMNINASTILPAISIKDFLLKFVKFFKLNIEVTEDEKIRIFKQNYKLSQENLLIDESLNNTVTNLFDYSKLTLSTNLPENDLITNYEKIYKKKYAQQIINTGYRIKSTKKDITFDNGIPFYMIDNNVFAYDRFCKYSSGGYSKEPYGYTKGLNDISFGYLKKINLTGDTDVKLIVSNDSWFESGFYPQLNNGGQTEKMFINPYLVYDPSKTNLFEVWSQDLTKQDGSNYYTFMDEFYTFCPYVFGDDGVIIKSLEFSKSEYNYANISDSNYPIEATHYYRFFRKNIIDFLNSDTKILKTKLYINNKLDFSNIYNYRGVYFIIKNLLEYDYTKPDVYEVELLKINDLTNYIE